MPKVTFEYDLNIDAWSWVVVAQDKNIFGTNWEHNTSHIPKNILSQIQKTDTSQAIEITEKYLKDKPDKAENKKNIKAKITTIEQIWAPIEKKYFKSLSAITDKPIYTKKFKGFITTGYMCPYEEKENWFMISIIHSAADAVTTICHEIMHFQFLYHYKKHLLDKGLTGSQIETLKEALTFLLNEPEFDEVIIKKDIGYEEHQELRQKLKGIWEETKNFQELINKAIPEIKTMQ